MDCKVVLVGDSKCGKTTLIHRFTNDNFLQVYTPTGFERYTVNHEIGDFGIHFTIWDTSGANAYDNVRPLSYQDAKAFLICFDVTSQVSLHNSLKKWYPEICKYSDAPIVLCGCQSDKRIDNKHLKYPVSIEQAVAAARQMGAITYVETSSKDSEKTVIEAFEVAALAALGKVNKSSYMMTFVRQRAPHLKKHLLHRPSHRTCILM